MYFGLSAIEFALNNVTGASSLKYLGAAILVLILASAYKNNEQILIGMPQIFLLFWLFLALVSVFWTPSIDTAKIYINSYINIIMFYVVITAVKFTRSDISLFINSMFIGSFVSVILVVFFAQPYDGGERFVIALFGANSEPNNLAAFIVISTTYSLWRIFKSKSLVLKLMFVTVFLLSFIALFKTGSRAGFITAVLASTVIFVGKAFIENRLKFKKVGEITLISLTTLLASFFLLNRFVNPYLLDRIFGFDTYDSGSNRTILWKYGFELLKENPIFGYGLGSYLAMTSKVMHNTYFTVFFEQGIIGGIVFLGFILSILYTVIKKRLFLALAILISGLVPAFFIDSMNKRFLWNALIISSIIVNYHLMKKIKKDNSFF
ncbi:O-antigen ligase family protein [Neobacillus notoginsengisoli]|nr:O-antigen ligase family protein [Neobacillus notoginsengisoli]